MVTSKLPILQDRVRHKTSAEFTTGTVIARYSIHKNNLLVGKRIEVLDVRTDDDQIIYETPAENWETVATEEEMFE